MKQLDINRLGLEEVSANEIVSTNGGVVHIPWLLYEVLSALGLVAMGVTAGIALYKDLHEHEKEVEVYYGGELDAAVCIG